MDVVTVRTQGEELFEHGDTVFLTPDPTRVYRFDKAGLAIPAADCFHLASAHCTSFCAIE
jgi:hypothetical protein